MKAFHLQQKPKKPTSPHSKLKSRSFYKKLRYDFQRHGNLSTRNQNLRDSLSTLERYISDYNNRNRSAPQTRIGRYVIGHDQAQIKDNKNQQQAENRISSPSLGELTKYQHSRRELRSARPQCSISPIQIPGSIIATSMNSQRRVASARQRPPLSDFTCRLSEQDLPRAMRKEISLMSSLLMPCTVQKKVLTSRASTSKPDPDAITSKRSSTKKPLICPYQRARCRQSTKPNRAVFNKFNISAWEVFKNEQGSICQ